MYFVILLSVPILHTHPILHSSLNDTNALYSQSTGMKLVKLIDDLQQNISPQLDIERFDQSPMSIKNITRKRRQCRSQVVNRDIDRLGDNSTGTAGTKLTILGLATTLEVSTLRIVIQATRVYCYVWISKAFLSLVIISDMNDDWN